MLKRLLLIFGLVSICAGGALFYLWQKATYSPSWYKQANTAAEVLPVTDTESGVPKWMKVYDKVVKDLKKQGNQGKGKIELSADDINTLVAYGFDAASLSNNVAEDTTNQQAEKIVLGTNTKFQNGKMIVGAMVNLKQLAQRQLSKDSGDGAAQALLSLPFVSDRAVYIEVEGKPTVKNGNIALEPNSRVTIAGFGSTLPELAKSLNMPASTLEERIINRAIRLPMKVEAIEIVSDAYGGKQRLIVTGTATAF
jgi:hypothetical protein